MKDELFHLIKVTCNGSKSLHIVAKSEKHLHQLNSSGICDCSIHPLQNENENDELAVMPLFTHKMLMN